MSIVDSIETERLVLRPYELGDLTDAMCVLGDPLTMSFYQQPYTEKQVRDFICRNVATFKEGGYGLFAVIEKETETFAGDCGITIQDIDGAKEFEIGYRLGRQHWGQGYAPEAAAAVRDYGFQALSLKKLCSYMPSNHTQSRRVAEKIGMKIEKEFINPRNRNLPTTVYSIFKR